MRLLISAVCVLTLAANTVSPLAADEASPAFYPIGIYGVGSTNDFDTVKQGGFNVITGPGEKGFLDAAQKAGLKVLSVPGGTQAGPHFNPGAVRKSVKSFDAHPAVWAWYLSDEPDLNLISPDAVATAQRIVKEAGARKPTALVIYQGYSALDYANIADITMVDRYPIPWLPLANFGQHVEMVRLALGKEKPLIAVIQAFDWTRHEQSLPGQKNLRPPTYEEMRCMTYDALARGATGLFYFAFDAGWKMREHPVTWSALTNIIGEVSRRLPLFKAKGVWWPRDHAFGDPARQYNAALQSSVTSRLLRVTEPNAALPAGLYVLAVNNTGDRLEYSFALPPPHPSNGGGFKGDGHVALRAPRSAVESPSITNDHAVSVLGEARSLQPAKGRLQDEFEPYGLHVYGPLQ